MERNFTILTLNRYSKEPTFIVVNEDDEVLCQGLRNYPYIEYDPIRWKEYKDCEQWCNFGFIGEIQESFGNLDIRFRKNFIENIRDKRYE